MRTLLAKIKILVKLSERVMKGSVFTETPLVKIENAFQLNSDHFTKKKLHVI